MILYLVIVIVGIVLVGSIIYWNRNKNKWFNSLKVGDKVFVKIYSLYCDCKKEATVIKEADDSGRIEIELSPDIQQRCVGCAEINGTDENGSSCLYETVRFSRCDVYKIRKNKYE